MGRGSMARLRRFAAKLLAGQPVTVGARWPRLASGTADHELFCANARLHHQIVVTCRLTGTANVISMFGYHARSTEGWCDNQRAVHMTSVRHRSTGRRVYHTE